MARALPHLWVHDDRAVETGHLVRTPRARQSGQFIMTSHHVLPPAFLEVALQRHPKRTVIPEAVQTAINLTRLKNKSASLGERDDLVHARLFVWIVHGASGGMIRLDTIRTTDRVRLGVRAGV